MNKTMLCIEILQLLSAKNIMNKNEIADILEINSRNVIEYIKTLQDCGYDIESIRGVHGGYHLNKENFLPKIKLSEKEISLLKSTVSFLEHRSDFLEYNEYVKVVSKILSVNVDTISNDVKIIDRFPLAMPKGELLKRYNLFLEAMTLSKKCSIRYLSTKNKEHIHIIHPYQVFIFNGAWLVLAWNETVNEFGYFKLNRIKDIEILNQGFTILKTYNSSDYVDQYGMKNNGEYYDIKVEFRDLYTVISERIYGKNQRIVKIDEHRTLLECSMQNKDMIKSFILGFGSKVKVIEPVWLKEEIKNEIRRMLENE